MQRKDYWNLFWLSGMPEAWMLSRPTEGCFFPVEPAAKGMTALGNDLPEEVRQMQQSKPGELS